MIKQWDLAFNFEPKKSKLKTGPLREDDQVIFADADYTSGEYKKARGTWV